MKHPEQEEVGADIGLEHFAGKSGERIGADRAADHSRNGETEQQFLVDIAEAPMSDARGAGGEGLGRVHAGARGGGRHAEAEQHRARGDAIGHADGAVDHLRDETDDDVKKDVVPHAGPRDVRDAGLAPPPARRLRRGRPLVAWRHRLRKPRSWLPRSGRSESAGLWHLLGGFGVGLDRRADADEMAVAIDVVDAVDRRPVLVDAEGAGGEAGGLARIGPVPFADRSSTVCGAFLSGLLVLSMRPSSIARASSRIASIASQKRSSSALVSDSVGSIISVPATGQLMVGGWKPQSISRLATSSTVTPAVSLSGRVSMMHSCATRPFFPV